MINKIVKLAEAQIGNNYEKYCRDMGYNYRIEWCACFVSWLAKQCGAENIIPISMSCNRQIDMFPDFGGKVMKTKPYDVRVGDVLYYNWDNTWDADHVGIVSAVNGDIVTVIEGNNGEYPNDRVRTRRINRNNSLIYCVVRPNYEQSPIEDNETEDTSGAYPEIKWHYNYDAKIEQLQRILVNKGLNVEIDGQAGDETYNAVRRYTIELWDMGPLTKWVQERLTDMGFDCGYPDGYAEEPTMDGIAKFQKHYKLGVGYLGGTDWYYILRGNNND